MTAYCVKCRAKKKMSDAVSERLKDGHTYYIGTCPDCGAKMFRRVADG